MDDSRQDIITKLKFLSRVSRDRELMLRNDTSG